MEEEEVNRFLRGHRVMTIDRQFSEEHGGYWTLLVTWQENGSPAAPEPAYRSVKRDYREILTDEQFDLFAKMKDLRRELANKENKPAYAFFTDEELSQIVRLPQISVAAMKQIKGVGRRAEKYGPQFVGLVAMSEVDEAGREPDAADS